MNTNKNMARALLFMALLILLAFAATAALAHNAGWVLLPNGECVNVGSGFHNSHVDLIEGPGDQYGTRYAAEQGNSRVSVPATNPGDCRGELPRTDRDAVGPQ
jgi:hypothetical protein